MRFTKKNLREGVESLNRTLAEKGIDRKIETGGRYGYQGADLVSTIEGEYFCRGIATGSPKEVFQACKQEVNSLLFRQLEDENRQLKEDNKWLRQQVSSLV
ncbi:MAG: hypothetical protein DWQ49_09415 [Bacteroidetes bacterium]|nr:MAG: hypothetical protein DWQ49_09415 [Bacteroidota bacterium]